MTGICRANAAEDAVGNAHADDGGARFILGVAQGLHLAAAPAFAAMALLTATAGDGVSESLCAAALGASPLTGMTAMYLLMSVFHAAPWLRLVER